MSKDLCKYIGMWGLRQCKAEQQEVDSYLNGADVEAGMEKFDEDTFKLIGVILCWQSVSLSFFLERHGTFLPGLVEIEVATCKVCVNNCGYCTLFWQTAHLLRHSRWCIFQTSVCLLAVTSVSSNYQLQMVHKSISREMLWCSILDEFRGWHTPMFTWLILPVVICLSQRLSHACLSLSYSMVKLRMAHYISYNIFSCFCLHG